MTKAVNDKWFNETTKFKMETQNNNNDDKINIKYCSAYLIQS